MMVFIQNLENNLFMNSVSQWAPEREAYDFRTPAFAIDLCMMRRMRGVRIVIDMGDPAENIFLDVYGTDLGALREGIRNNRQLREEQKLLKGALDAVRAAQKERKKQVAFKRNQVSEDSA